MTRVKIYPENMPAAHIINWDRERRQRREGEVQIPLHDYAPPPPRDYEEAHRPDDRQPPSHGEKEYSMI